MQSVNLSVLIETTTREGNDQRHWGDWMRSLRFLDSTRQGNFFFTFFFPSRIYFFFFLSCIPEFRNVYIRWSTTSRVQFHTAAKRWQHSTVLRRIKMTDRRLEGGKCYEKRQFLHQFIVSFRLSRFFKYIGRYLLAFNKCLINFNLQGDALLSYYLF